MKSFVLFARVVFGAWMVAGGLNHFGLPLWPEPTGTQPLAVELIKALGDSHLIDVTYGIQLVAGALILTGIFLPFALCAAMPVSVGAAFWTVVLEHQPLGAALGLLAVALNALLMFAYLNYYRGVLRRQSSSYGEAQQDGMDFATLYVNPRGSTPISSYSVALIMLLAAFAFYHLLVWGRTGQFAVLMLLYPALVLHARRLHAMGKSGWLVLIPGAALAATAWLNLYRVVASADLVSFVTMAGAGLALVFIFWGVLGKDAAPA